MPTPKTTIIKKIQNSQKPSEETNPNQEKMDVSSQNNGSMQQ